MLQHSMSAAAAVYEIELKPKGQESLLTECTFEAYTEGNERRAHVLAELREVTHGVFTVTPYYLREISGPDIRWHVPRQGQPIATCKPIKSFSEARAVLVWWATTTFAENANERR